jgi:2-isopropylmalate synthase
MMKIPTTIKLLDTTLREGEQALGVCFSVAEKIEIARLLDSFGVSFIEIGHPGISKEEEQACGAICSALPHIEFLVHARALVEDIHAAKNTNAPWVGIWASYNDISLAAKFTNKDRAWIQEQVRQSIGVAKQVGLKIRFTIEDASRTSLDLILELAKIAVLAGADRISLADTLLVRGNPRNVRKLSNI